MTPTEFDVVVIGGGIAGVSIGYELAADRRVCLVEQEGTLAFHTTGRSAALYLETFGNASVRALTGASRAQLTDPPADFDGPILASRPYLVFAREGRGDALTAFYDDVRRQAPAVELLSADDAVGLAPYLRRAAIEAALIDPASMDVDVHALHQGYVRGLRRRGGEIRTHAAVTALDRAHGVWTAAFGDGRTVRAPVVVDAAGAWADTVAECAGAAPIGVRPMVRTIFGVDAPEGLETSNLPVVNDLDDAFYIKPEANGLLCSPADETPSHPHDVRPGDLEIARAIDSINEVTDLRIRHVRSSWAGLRTFAPDRSPVVGFDPGVEGFFWFAGQGGYGIQMADGLARSGAAVFRGEGLPDDVVARGAQASALAPDRF
ncbi:FAD-binding oxidoreductase [Gordonia sp. HY285]|uniref:NAD(P)/FAD-dependent oxidoreductase n=1 Tax=Gordonia liuliyuniae TaxID=2911517 RepID=UPI001F45342D|nr:FAD-dependent oxidoreductase [Gordonia liuliyuniae]MCF8611573.1 FAD-binding oxidoreductase [Gordonia liuliyuniae]